MILGTTTTNRTGPLAFAIAVDGGGSGCRIRLADMANLQVLAEARGGPANLTTNPEQSALNIRETLDDVLNEADLDKAALLDSAIVLGLAGLQTKAQADGLAATLPCGRIIATEDRPTMLRGALGQSQGAMAAIGTGSFLACRTNTGTRFAGGWGFAVSDQASGAWLGRKALETALLVHDGLKETSPLIDALLTRFGGQPTGIVAFCAMARPADYATLAPQITQAAEDGDHNAVAMMQAGARYIAEGLKSLDWTEGLTVCLSGGLGPAYAAHLPAPMRATLQPPKGSALDGAMHMAMELAQTPDTEKFRARWRRAKRR